MTRMWGADPRILCQNHILGEHREMHQVKGTVEKHPHGEAVLEGLAEENAIDTTKIKKRHDALVEEMKRRGWDGHDSPMEDVENQYGGIGKINEVDSVELLVERCEDCRERWREGLKLLDTEMPHNPLWEGDDEIIKEAVEDLMDE